MARAPEVVVIGGGPAGAAASLLLASWGHTVQLITKAGGEHHLAVSIPPSCGKLFDAIGVTEAIDRASFIRSTGNTVWWGGEAARVETFATGALGWQVDAARLADVILACATAAGVRVERRMLTESPGSFVLDCTGRAGVIARAKNVRKYDGGPRTIALVGEWRHDGSWPVPDDTHTLIESYDTGWMWSVPVAPGVRHIAAMIDPQRSDLSRSGSAREVYLAEIAKTQVFKRLSGEASLQDGPRGWDATPYRAGEYAGDGWLLVGDAGSFIDPLSSAGVKKALASAWLAAVAAHTCITNPSLRSQALEFFSAREQEIEHHLSREGRRFLAGAAQGHRHAFWDDRDDDRDEDASDSVDVQRAFERLKTQDEWKVKTGPAITIEPRPIIRGNDIVLEPHLVSRETPRGVRYVRGIDLVLLVELAPSFRSVPDLFDACARRLGPISLHDFLVALATAVARGWLVAE